MYLAGNTVNSKERVRLALTGGRPDRVPVLPQICPPHAIRLSGRPFRETVVDRLRNPRAYDLMVGSCAREYGLDGFRVWVGGPPMDISWNGEDFYARDPSTGDLRGLIDFNGGGGILTLPEGRRMLTDRDIAGIETPDVETILDSAGLAPVRACVREFAEDMFVVGVPGQFTVETMSHIQGMEQTLVDIIDRPGFIREMTERRLQRSINYAIAMVRAGVDGLYIGETFGQFMSQEQFADLCVPYFRRFVEAVKPHGPVIYLHMCGRIDHLLDLIPETGVDALEPLDVVAGTKPELVRSRLGGGIGLMGGVSTLVLSAGSVEAVREECLSCIRRAGADGGYVLAACDMLPTETSPEKVRAMVEMAASVGQY